MLFLATLYQMSVNVLKYDLNQAFSGCYFDAVKWNTLLNYIDTVIKNSQGFTNDLWGELWCFYFKYFKE